MVLWRARSWCGDETLIGVWPVLQSPKSARKPTARYANTRMIVKLELEMTQQSAAKWASGAI